MQEGNFRVAYVQKKGPHRTVCDSKLGPYFHYVSPMNSLLVALCNVGLNCLVN